MYPRSGFRSGGAYERTLVPVFVPGEHPNVPSFRFSFRVNIRQNHPFGKAPFCQPPSFVSRFVGTCCDVCQNMSWYFLGFPFPLRPFFVSTDT